MTEINALIAIAKFLTEMTGIVLLLLCLLLLLSPRSK